MLQKHFSSLHQPLHPRKKVKILPSFPKIRHPVAQNSPAAARFRETALKIFTIQKNNVPRSYVQSTQEPYRQNDLQHPYLSSTECKSTNFFLDPNINFRQLAHKYLNSIYPPQNQRHIFQYFKTKNTKIQEKNVALQSILNGDLFKKKFSLLIIFATRNQE